MSLLPGIKQLLRHRKSAPDYPPGEKAEYLAQSSLMPYPGVPFRECERSREFESCSARQPVVDCLSLHQLRCEMSLLPGTKRQLRARESTPDYPPGEKIQYLAQSSLMPYPGVPFRKYERPREFALCSARQPVSQLTNTLM
jgi:hypothetical protein